VGARAISTDSRRLLAIEGAFKAVARGEVGGAKIAGALELAAKDKTSRQKRML